MAHVVYLITLPRRRDLGLKPYMYVGSKSNSTFFEGKILNKKGREYWGSPRDPRYLEFLSNDEPFAEVLHEASSYREVLELEKKEHLSRDVVMSPEYFNKAIATVGTYCDPSYATMRHEQTGKTARVRRDDPRVISGEWVGVTKDIKLSEETIKKITKFGEENGFFGKRHSEETKLVLSKKKREFYSTDKGKEVAKVFSDRVSKMFKGVPKTVEHRRKIGRKGLVLLKNIVTGECTRMRENPDPSIWKNPASLKQARETCKVCGMTSVIGNIRRWHNENCKRKT